MEAFRKVTLKLIMVIFHEKGSRISWHTSIKYVDISKSLCVQDNNSAEMYKLASFPGRAQLSVACSTVKRGEPGIFSHVSIT